MRFGSFAMLAMGLLGLVGAVGAPSAAGAAAPPVSPAVVTQATEGLLTGNVVIRNAPAGFQGQVGVAACPATVSSTGICQSPLFALAMSGASYTLALSAGTWQVYEFYEIGYGGGAYVGRPHAVSIVGGATVRKNISVQYQVPSTVGGTVAVTGVPSGVTIGSLLVTACPSSQPLVSGNPSLFCDSDYVNGSGPYSIPTLFKGRWLLYVGYYSDFGFTQVATPTTVNLPKGGSVAVDLSVAYQTPANGALEGTVTITGAPPGFSPPFAGAGACPIAGGSGTVCPNPSYTLIGPGNTYQLPLSPGQWGAAGFYELGGFAGQFLSQYQTVSVSAGVIDQVNFTVPYVKPATVQATVTVTGVPAGVSVENTQLLACPSGDPYDGTTTPIECVETGSAGSVDTINTLPPGTWLLYPGYFTSDGSFEIGTQATTVKLKAGKTKRVSLSVAYRPL